MSSKITQALDGLRTDFTLNKPLLVGEGNLKSLLDLAGLDSNVQNAVAQAFVQHEGITPEFWTELETNAGLDSTQIAELKNTVDLGIVTENHLPMLQNLKAILDDAEQTAIRTVRDFAKLSPSEWATIVQSGREFLDTEDLDRQADANTQAAALQREAERLFPDVALVAEVGRHSEHGLSEVSAVSQFMDTFPDFNLGHDDIAKHNADNGNVLADTAVEEAKVIQRVHHLAPNARAGAALLDEKLHSSMQIYFKGEDRVIEGLAKRQIDKTEATRIYRQAEHQYSLVLSKIARYRFDLMRDNPAVVPDFTYTPQEIEEFKRDIPNLELLFGSLDYCECEHCSSMYSPAAYLTDLLRFLEEKDGVASGKTVQDILFERRPDLRNIKLNCENTDTRMPYIDLVNEILENAIEPQASDFSYQSTLSEAELRAVPEHIRPHAYAELSHARYPMNTAFNLWQEETRLLLKHLGVPRHRLMRAFQNNAGAIDADGPADTVEPVPAQVDIAAEYFGISTQEQSIILPPTSEADADRQAVYWGLDTTQDSLAVSTFLDKTRLTYHELLDLIQVQYVNPEDNPSTIHRPIDDCAVDQQIIDGLSLEKFDRIHRFLRLWRRTGWAMWELDLLIRNPLIGDGKLDESCLVALQEFSHLQERLALSAEELLAFFGEINTEIRVAAESASRPIRPLYHRLFLNPAVSTPTDAGFELPLAPTPLADHKTMILSALAISAEDFDHLAPKTDGQLSLTSLSILYRYVTLAKKLRLAIRDLLLLLQITRPDDSPEHPSTDNPFASPRQLQALLQDKETITGAGFSLRQLHYILSYAPESSAGLRTAVIARFAGQLRTSLANLQDDLLNANESSRELVGKHLSKIPDFADSDLLTTALDLIEGIWLEDDAARLDFIDTYIRLFIPSAAEPHNTLTQENFYVDGRLTADAEEAISARYAYVSSHLYHYLNASLITAHIAANLNLPDAHAQTLLNRLSLPDTSVSLRGQLQVETLIARDATGDFVHTIDRATFPEIFHTYELLHKLSMLLENFRLETEELAWFIDHHGQVHSLDPQSLPITGPPAAPLFAQWRNWWKLLEFKQQFPEPEAASFYEILTLGAEGATDIETILGQLADLTQWRKTDLQQLHQKLGFEHGPDESRRDYAHATTYHRLWTCAQQMRRTGVDAATLFSWAQRPAAAPPTNGEEGEQEDSAQAEAIARAVRQAVKSKYELEDWLAIIEPLQDELRQKKRNALAAYLIEHAMRHEPAHIETGGQTIANPKYWQSTNDLFGYFLIDVEMNPCQLTTRISRAINSIQLFVQRCLLNLEAHFVRVPKDDPDLENNWKQWKWMKNYRVWEANRKVFFYPENWIEPELRDDKSPFFEELENEIAQNEITHAHVEQAFLNYLQKVDEVANLEVVGLHHDQRAAAGEGVGEGEEGGIDEVHVIARTKTMPHAYYHRIYDFNYATWSPWEKVEIDITGDHILPVIYNGKLHLFWLVFDEKPVEVKRSPGMRTTTSANGNVSVPPSDSAEQPKVLEIQLAWTVKKHDGWAPKVVGKEKLIHPWQRPHHSYHMRPRYKGGDNTLWIDLFISTSEAFNDNRFFDQFTQRRTKYTKTDFNQRYRPWQSSSFVFNGSALEIKLRGMLGWYYKPEKKGKYHITSQEYVQQNFGEAGRAIQPLNRSELGSRLALPSGMHYKFNALTNNDRHHVNRNRLNIPNSSILLRSAHAPFRAVLPMQIHSRRGRPFVYQDDRRAFFARTEWRELMEDFETRASRTPYTFFPLYHPYTTLFINELNRSGIDGLLSRKIQVQPRSFPPGNDFDFNNTYAPTSSHRAEPHATAERDIVDFSFSGAYSLYNWEIFFHAPMLIAGKLSQNQRFEEAMRWYHYVFDPTNTENLPLPQRYWITKPFYEHSAEDYRKQRIENLLNKIDEHRDQVMAWKNNPFMPHLIARYRPVAYQRNVVMKYIDNLIAWGDQLFRRDTAESINEASLLYMLAQELLGDRPQAVPAIPRRDMTFGELQEEGAIDFFGNNRVEIAAENDLGFPSRAVPARNGSEPLPRLETRYFCIPHNDKLLGYWNTVEDRLFKIRNCMNIEGTVRQLAPFAPPIDPALLVKAAAAGVDLGSVLNELGAPAPNYRFRVLYQAAVQFCSDVKALGEKLLSVLQAKDAEELALLRSSLGIRLQEAVREVHRLQVDEADENIEALRISSEIAVTKAEYYASVPRMHPEEESAASAHERSILPDQIALGLHASAGVAHLVPTISAGASGFGGSPVATFQAGGGNLASSLSSLAAVSQSVAQIMRTTANELEKQANYTRMDEQNEFQKELAEQEKQQIDRQILAAAIRKEIHETEKLNHDQHIEHLQTEDEYMRNKYTNEQLYSWMVSQISSVYFQTYQLAYDMAKRAERSFRYELGLQDSSYIQFGYWDSLKKGLLAGDKLMHDLYRMESAYYEQNKRELELTKHISLAQVAPWCLLELQATGSCTLDIPEWLFDMDYPGHYLRRIKSVSVTIPCVTGPYTGIHCTLSLHNSRIRISNVVGSSYAMTDAADERFRHEYGTIQSIATSHGQNDAGLFELNFADERYLPFEGAGVIGTWELNMPQANNQFDFNTISDVILHIQYTARNGGTNLAGAAQDVVEDTLPTSGVQLLTLRHHFPTAWHRFLHPTQAEAEQEFILDLRREHYPFFAGRANAIRIAKIDFVLNGAHDAPYRLQMQLPGQTETQEIEIPPKPALDNMHHTEHDFTDLPSGEGEWRIKIRRDADSDFSSLPPDDLQDVMLLIHFYMD